VRVIAELLNISRETLLDLFRREITVNVVVFFSGFHGWAEEHRTPHREVNRDHERGDADDRVAEVLETLVGFNAVGREEERGGDGGTSVTARTNETGHNTERAAGDERHDTVRSTFRRLHANGEENHERDGGAEGVLGDTHEDAKHTFESLAQPQRPKTTTHAKTGGRPIGQHTTDGAREEVHQTVARRQDAGGLQRHAELIKEVAGDDVVHRQFDTEAETIRGNHAPHAVVHHSELVHVPRGLLFNRTRGREHLVVAVG